MPHHLRRVSLDLALPLGGNERRRERVAHAARSARLRSRARALAPAGERPADGPGRLRRGDVAAARGARPAFRRRPGARGAETAGAGAALALLLRALGAIDGAGGSVPDAIEHLLNDAGARLRALAAAASSRSALVAALRALWPQGADAADGEILVAAGPLAARVSLAPPWRVEVSAGSGRGHRRRHVDRCVRLVRLGRSPPLRRERRRRRLARVLARLRQARRSPAASPSSSTARSASRCAWSRPGAAAADELELWPTPQPAAFERALARLVPAELTRQALEGLRGLDESARPIVDAALSVVGLLGDADASGVRRVLLPAAFFADAAAWLRSEAALGLGAAFAPAKLVALLDALRPLLGVATAGGVAGTWALAPGVTLRADADASGSARLGLAIDTSTLSCRSAQPGG